MQKKIFSSLLIVSICGIILSGTAFFVIQTFIARRTADAVAMARLYDAEDRIRTNNERIKELSEIVREDNLARARALALLIQLEPGVFENNIRLEEIGAALDVEEINIIDEQGVLRWGTQPDKFGLNFRDTEQTRPFLAILHDPTVEISQTPMPDITSGNIRQYAGVALHDRKGIAQVGLVPRWLLEALNETEISNTLGGIAVGNTGYIFSVSHDGEILYHPNPELKGNRLRQALKDSGFLDIDGQKVRYCTRFLTDQTLVTAYPAVEMYSQRTYSTVFFVMFIVVLFILFCAIVNVYIGRTVVKGILDILAELEEITAGNLDKNVSICSCEEFERLSGGINHMLRTIKGKMWEISELAGDRARLGAIAAIADAGIIVKDKDGIVQEWNIGAENILGYTPDEMIGKSTKNYSPQSSYDGINQLEEALKTGTSVVHVDVVRKHKDGRLIDCTASYTPVFNEDGSFGGSVAIFHDISDKKRVERALKEAILAEEEKNNIIISGLNYASKIQRSLLPKEEDFKNAFSDYFVIWEPRDEVGGDIYWLKTFDEGTVLCVCDCTGHGTPGALLSMLVVSAFETIVNQYNYKDTAKIMWKLEQRLVSVLHVNAGSGAEASESIPTIKDGCDLAILYISKEGEVTVSSGNTRVFICDGNEVRQIKGQRLFIGEGKLKSEQDVNVITVPANPDNKFYIASDGLFDQPGGKQNLPFGYKRFMELILKNHDKRQDVIAGHIWDEFESYSEGQVRRDDFELVTFKP